MNRQILAGCVLFWMAGCGSDVDRDLEVGCTEQAAMSYNSIGYNALGYNSMAYNGLAYNGRPLNGLPLQGIAVDTGDACGSPLALQLMEYTVGCALAPDQEVGVRIDGTEHRLRGQIGLAPEWAREGCDERCEDWVSACLIARINARGERVEISLRGDHPALALAPGEARAFPHEEAAYYGNVFADPMALSACVAGDEALDRVCGEIEDCPVEAAGACAEVCDASGCLDVDGQRHRAVVHVFRDEF